jgi:hypothetical protein
MPKDLHKPVGARSSPRFFEPSAEPEFSWPPRPEDLEACAIVSLQGDDAGQLIPLVLAPAEVDIVTAEPTPVSAPPPVSMPVPVPLRTTVELRPRRVITAGSLPDTPSADPDAAGATRSAWLAVFAAAACLVIAYSQFRIEWTRGTVPTVVLKSAPAPEAEPTAVADAAPEPPATIVPASAARSRSTSPRPASVGAAPAVMTADLRDEAPPLPMVSQAGPVAAELPPILAAYVEPPRPEPVAVVRPEPIATRVEDASPANEEDDIRTTLTRWRTAYSQLNAGAAQEVWPSVDVRALRTAFRGIKSQELHFDRCQLTVTGERAQAACRGRAVYVPGVGDPSPRTSAREWTFELKKADERWTIASARSS